MSQPEIAYIEVGGRSIAYRRRSGNAPALLFLPGYASDMEGAKALALDAFAAGRGHTLVRFDYSGTGASGGAFADGTLDRWLDEALAVIDQLTDGPVILVGSSMGGWIALHAAARRPARVAAVVGIAAAPDFTDWGGDGLAPAFRESGQRLLLLGGEIAVDCPVRLVHGAADPDVPLDIAFRTMRGLRSADVQVTVIKDGGHRLSEPHQIATILSTVDALLEPAA